MPQRPAPAPARPEPAPQANRPAAARPVEEDKPLPQTFFLGRYRVVDEIGVGGMASVHLARVDGPGGFQKWIAIKRIHPHLVEDDQFVDMFLDEARIAAGINHANVAQVFDLGKDDNTYWIAMEYLHGEPLREVMRRAEEVRTIVPPHIAARICADAAEGLHAAHELRGRNGQLLGLVHRDVTPHNLFVTYDGYTKVVDFGIAKVIDRLASTRAGTLKGKLAYMSPEQVRGQDVDRRTDIFALGVVLWEITTNQRLFRMETDLDTLEKVQACAVPLPSTKVPNYPKELEQVVMTALAPRPEQRFQTARDFSRALQRYLMTSGYFVGPEDVGEYVKNLFADRVQKREKYLEWAAEVTSTVDLETLRARQQGAGPPPPTPSVAGPSAGHADASAVKGRAPVAHPPQQPVVATSARAQAASSSGSRPVTSAPALVDLASTQIASPDLGATSLMDDDEEIPTVVAMRDEEMNNIGRPRPAAGMPGASPQPYVPNAPSPQAGWPPAPQQQQLSPGAMQPGQDLQSTIALPDAMQTAAIQQELRAMESRQAQAQAQRPGPQPTAALPAFPAQSPYAAPQPQYAPAHAPVAQLQQAPAPVGGHQDASQAGQSNVETKMSMPRPAAVAQWLAEQGNVQIGGPRGMGTLTSIAMLAALCAMALGALVVYKVRAPAALAAVPEVKLSPEDEPRSLLPPDIAKVDTTAGGVAPKVNPKASASAGPTTATTAAAASASGATSAPTAPIGPVGPPPTGGDQGTINVSCSPRCDSITIGGSSYGDPASARVSPGQHRITGTRSGSKAKTISVMVEAGQSVSRQLKLD
ncbi:MAG: protein kinase [Myxococcales bacterium]|nr:protein kinase [Myxococcales bacterium]